MIAHAKSYWWSNISHWFGGDIQLRFYCWLQFAVDDYCGVQFSRKVEVELTNTPWS